MCRKLDLIAFIFLIMVPGSIFAEVWISLDIPTVFRFSSGDRSIFSAGSSMSGVPSGTIIHVSLPILPVMGVEKYQIGITGDSSSEPVAVVDVDFINIAYYSSSKNVSFLIGYGLGTMKTKCKADKCSDYSFEKGDARQYYGHLGIPLFAKVDFYLSAHWVIGKNSFTYSSQEGELELSGILCSLGFKVEW